MSCKIDEAIAELTRLLGVVGNKPAAEAAVSNMLGDIKRIKDIKDRYEVSTIDSLPKYVTGQKNMTYAGIGSRQTPPKMLVEMTKAAKMLADRGYTLQTGKTFGNKEEGADKAFSDGTSKKMLFGPEEYGTNKTALDVVKKLHPAPDKLSAGAKKLMARNTFQVFGKKLDTPVDFVLFYAEETDNPLRPKGGTGQAVEMARRNGIPTINMSEAGWEDKLAGILEQSGVVKSESSINNSTTITEYKVLQNVLTDNNIITLKKAIDSLLINPKFDTVSNTMGQQAIVFGPIEYSYSRKTHKQKDMTKWMTKLADDTSKLLGHKEGYYNQVLFNKFDEGKGIGKHQDAEGIYYPNGNRNVKAGSVAIYSVGDTSTKHEINGKEVTVPSGSLVELESGEVWHSVGKAAKGGRYSITFRHIPEENIAVKTETKSKESNNDDKPSSVESPKMKWNDFIKTFFLAAKEYTSTNVKDTGSIDSTGTYNPNSTEIHKDMRTQPIIRKKTRSEANAYDGSDFGKDVYNTFVDKVKEISNRKNMFSSAQITKALDSINTGTTINALRSILKRAAEETMAEIENNNPYGAGAFDVTLSIATDKQSIASDVITKLTTVMANKKIISIEAIINKIKDC